MTRQVGCEGDDGLLRVHDEAETCDVCGGIEAMDFSRHATWELKAMVKARSMLSAMNTAQEDAELVAIRAELRKRRNK